MNDLGTKVARIAQFSKATGEKHSVNDYKHCALRPIRRLLSTNNNSPHSHYRGHWHALKIFVYPFISLLTALRIASSAWTRIHIVHDKPYARSCQLSSLLLSFNLFCRVISIILQNNINYITLQNK